MRMCVGTCEATLPPILAASLTCSRIVPARVCLYILPQRFRPFVDVLLFNGSLLRGLQAACIVTGVVRTSALRKIHQGVTGFELSSISLALFLSLWEYFCSSSFALLGAMDCGSSIDIVRLLSLDAWCARISS